MQSALLTAKPAPVNYNDDGLMPAWGRVLTSSAAPPAPAL